MADILKISIAAILVYNFVLSRFLGICPFLGVSKKLDTALGMGMAVTFVMGFSSLLTYLVQKYLLVPFNLEYLQTITFILIIASLVQFVEMFLQKVSPALYSALGIYLPLITTNCAVLGSALIIVDTDWNLIEGVVFGTMSGVGFSVAILIFAGIRTRLEVADIPECLKGFPIALISAALLSMAFSGFGGMIQL